jgi:hypothetical protein
MDGDSLSSLKEVQTTSHQGLRREEDLDEGLEKIPSDCSLKARYQKCR